jgi:hypothetical protein
MECLDLHWHFFTMLVMLGGAFALSTNGHVQVDFLSQRFKPSTQKVIMVLGDVFFLLPFCIFMAWYGWRFTVTSFNMGEGSTLWRPSRPIFHQGLCPDRLYSSWNKRCRAQHKGSDRTRQPPGPAPSGAVRTQGNAPWLIAQRSRLPW